MTNQITLEALAFEQIKSAWHLRKFAPSWHTGYLFMSEYYFAGTQYGRRS